MDACLDFTPKMAWSRNHGGFAALALAGWRLWPGSVMEPTLTFQLLEALLPDRQLFTLQSFVALFAPTLNEDFMRQQLLERLRSASTRRIWRPWQSKSWIGWLPLPSNSIDFAVIPTTERWSATWPRGADKHLLAVANELKCPECHEGQMAVPAVKASLEKEEQLWGTLQMDTFHFKYEGFTYHFLLMLDEASGFSVVHLVIPPVNITSVQVIDTLQRCWGQYFGLLERIRCDLEGSFRGKMVEDFCHSRGIELSFVPAEHHESTGDVERMIGELKKKMSHHLRKKWRTQILSKRFGRCVLLTTASPALVATVLPNGPWDVTWRSVTIWSFKPPKEIEFLRCPTTFKLDFVQKPPTASSSLKPRSHEPWTPGLSKS